MGITAEDHQQLGIDNVLRYAEEALENLAHLDLWVKIIMAVPDDLRTPIEDMTNKLRLMIEELKGMK